MSRSEDLITAISKNIAYAQNDVKAKKSPSAHLAKAAGYAEELAALPDDQDSEPVSDDYFKPNDSPDDVYITGGSPGNPNGVSWTYGDAKRFWIEVFGKGLNIGRVRSTLTPGSVVLSPEGYAAATKLGRDSTDFAPEDYNPLGLPVVP